MTTRAIFPATFDPIHLGHVDIATRAKKLFDELIVAVYDRPLKQLAFGVEERVAMVEEAFEAVPGLKAMGYRGVTGGRTRQVGALAIVRGLRVFSDFELEFRMALANKRLAPELEVVCLIASEQHMHLASSTIREIASLGGDVTSMVPPHVNRALLAHFRNLGEDAAGSVDMVSLRD